MKNAVSNDDLGMDHDEHVERVMYVVAALSLGPLSEPPERTFEDLIRIAREPNGMQTLLSLRLYLQDWIAEAEKLSNTIKSYRGLMANPDGALELIEAGLRRARTRLSSSKQVLGGLVIYGRDLVIFDSPDANDRESDVERLKRDLLAVNHQLAAANQVALTLRKRQRGKPGNDELRRIIDNCRFRSTGRCNYSCAGRQMGVTHETAKRWISESGLLEFADGA